MLDVLPHTRLDADPALSQRACGSYWAVVQTHPQAEHWAKANLDRQGYQTFLPMMAVRVRDRATPTLWHQVKRPLFSSYCFVIVGSHWAPIASSRGVRRLLMSDGKPGTVATAAIDALRAVQDLPAPQTPFAPGTPCSLAAGPLASMPAVVLEVERETAVVSVMMLGALREMVVPLSSLMARE